jgi:hypothetical protein
MPGPAPKHPSARARRNNPKQGFTSLPAKGRTAAAPKWPLPADAKTTALRDLAQDKIASLTAELEDAEDGRTKGRLRRQLATAEQSAAILSLQIEQQADLELELWNGLWATPQATLWETSTAFARTLAQFVRWNVKGEQGDLDAAKEARLQRKDFGLTPMDLLKARAEIERVEEAEDLGNRRRTTPRKPVAKKGGKDDPRGGLFAVS